MSSVVIDVTTTIQAPVIDIQESVNAFVIESSTTTSQNTIDLSTTVVNAVVDVNQAEVRQVEINVEQGVIPNATPTISGKMKLYNSLGVNTDGSVNQNIVTNNLDLKVDKVTDKSLVLDTEIAKIPHSNRASLDLTVGTNTGDQDLSGKVDKVLNKSLILDSEILRLSKISGGQVEIDFGALPIYQKEFTITDSNVLLTSNITASIAYDAPTDKDLDELEMDSIYIICGQATNGTFKMLVRCLDGCYLADKFKINYSITI